MPNCSYLVSITKAAESNENYSSDDWDADSKRMVTLLEEVFLDKVKLSLITKNATLTSCHTEVEVAFEGDQVVGRAVIQFVSEGKCTLDKGALTKLLKGSEHAWDGMKIDKQAVPA